MTIAVYVLLEPNTGCYYFGSTGELEKRLQRHFRELSSNTHHNRYLQALWDIHEYLDTIVYPCETREEAYGWEAAFIETNRADGRLLNIGLNVSGGDNLTRHPEYSRIIDQRSKTLNQRLAYMSEKDRSVVYGRPGSMNGMFGRTHTPEARRRMSEGQTPEVRAATSARTKGMPLPTHVREQISERAKLRIGDKNPFYGKRHSVETKAFFESAYERALSPTRKHSEGGSKR